MVVRRKEPEAVAPASVYAGIAVCSIGVLMMEILLTRIFSFTVWYHLAYVTISTALLGFGAAGSLLSAFPRWMSRDVTRLAALCTAGAGVTLLASILILGKHPLEPSRILQEPAAFSVGLFGYYVAIATPFFLAGIAVAAPLAAFPAQVNRLYGADLLGAGIGCVAALVALQAGDGIAAIVACAAILVAAGAVYTLGQRLSVALGLVALSLLVTAPFAARVVQLLPAPSKEISRALSDPGTTMLFTRWSPVNRVDLYERGDPYQSFWTKWGNGKNFSGPKPRVLTIQYDGHNGTNVFGIDDDESLAFLDSHLLRTPYVLRSSPNVLVIGVGGGVDVVNAVRRKAASVTGVELQPITIELLTGSLVDFTNGIFLRPDVNLVPSEGRHFVRSTDERYDVIQITGVDTFSAQSTGAYVLAESYLYTVEAVSDYLDHLADDGILSIVIGDVFSGDETVPPPIITRLALTAREALQRRGIESPRRHILIAAHVIPFGSGGFVTADLLVKNTSFTTDDGARVREFLDPNGFKLLVGPEQSDDPALDRILRASGAELDELLDSHDVRLEPVTDDRPFFYHFLPWSSLFRGEQTIWYLPGSTTGLLMLAIMLVQSLLLGTVLIVLPLLRGARERLSRAQTTGFLIYFVGLGLGFMLIEISFVQKYVLVLGYPTYSLSITVFSLLVFAALGAWLSPLGWQRPQRFLIALLVVTVALVCIEVSLFPQLRDRLIAAPFPVRAGVTVLLQLPLGVALGMYFPTGVELIRRDAPRLVPWAWAVNGVASVASSVLAVILGMSVGFSAVALIAAGVYVVGTLALVLASRHVST